MGDEDLARARRFYRDRLGLEAVEERDGGLRYLCGETEFHLFQSSGAASGESTQIGFEVTDIDRVVADLRSRGVTFEAFDIAGFEVEDVLLGAADARRGVVRLLQRPSPGAGNEVAPSAQLFRHATKGAVRAASMR